MEKNNENQPSQEMNEARKPKRTFEEARKGLKLVTHDVFARECMKQLDQRLKEDGIL